MHGGGGSFLNRCQGLCAFTAFTMADRLSRLHNGLVGLRSAFTMAEILLSLTIIGVVAAITLPSLTGNINERTWATQKKALYARMSQAFPLLDSINTYDDAESFIAGALNTVTKINNVCSSGNLEDCGINTSMIGALNGTALTEFPGNWADLGGMDDAEIEEENQPAAGADQAEIDKAQDDANDAEYGKYTAAFETGNGESIVLYYNPNCVPDQEMAASTTSSEDWFNYVCVNMVYDLNSNKGPNTVGKDIGFMTVFYPTDPVVVSPVPDLSRTGSSTPITCSSDEYRVPNKFEAMSMALNNIYVEAKKLTDSSAVYQSSSKTASSTNTTVVYYVDKDKLKAVTSSSDATGYKQTRCVKR